MFRKTKILAIIVSLLFVSFLTGCTKKEKSELFEMALSQSSEPESIDPALNTSHYGITILNHTFEGLMKWADDGSGNAVLVTAQANNYDVSQDGLVYTFHIRPNAYWSDGKKVTSNDFNYAWNRAMDPKTGANYEYMLSGLNCKWETPDENTFIVRLSNPCPYFLEVCAFPIAFPVREDVINSYGDKWTFKKDTYINNGPYKYDEWSHNSYLRLVKNDNYYDLANLGPDSIKFYFMDDNVSRLAAFKNKQLNFIESIPSGEIESLLKSGDLNVNKSLGTTYIVFNQKNKYFVDANVRKAFSLAIDRNFIANSVLKGGQVGAGALIPYGIKDGQKDFRDVGGEFINTSDDAYTKNCEDARNALTLAGYPNGKGFPIIDFHCTFDKKFSEALQNMWHEVLGIKVNIIEEKSNVFLGNLKEGNFKLAFTGWISNYNDPVNFLDAHISNGLNNYAKYSNPEFDKLIEKTKITVDKDQRMDLLHLAEKILLSDYVIAPIYHTNSPYMIQDIKNWYYSPLGYYFFANCKKVLK